jgi:hypothetical protein
VNPKVQESPRAPYWAIWLGLVGIVIVLIVAAFLLNRQFGARIGTQPGAVSTASPSPSTQASASVASAVAAAAAVNTFSSTGASAVPSASADNSPLAQQVFAAYQRYWQVYSDALLNLDTSQVSQVATGDELDRIQQEVAGFHAKNHALRVVVDHHFFVFDVTPNDAKVYDETRDRSYTVDPVTKQPPTGPDQADIEKDIYFLQAVDGTWKVTKSVRQSVSPS